MQSKLMKANLNGTKKLFGFVGCFLFFVFFFKFPLHAKAAEEHESLG